MFAQELQCYQPTLVWHQEDAPDDLILSPIIKEFPDVSERWGVKPCPSNLIYIPLNSIRKIRLPKEQGTFEASEGTIENGIWTPNVSSKPRVAWIRHTVSGKDPSYTLYGISAPAEIPIQATPNTNVTVDIHGTLFGPVETDESGFVELRVLVPPDASSANIMLENQVGQTSTNELKLSQHSLIVPHWRDSAIGPFLDILTYNARSKNPLPLSCEGGVILQNNHRYMVIPKPEETLECTVNNRLLSIPTKSSHPKPAILNISTFPRIMSADRPISKVQLRALDRDQNPLDPRGLSLQADIGKIKGAIVDMDFIGEYDGTAARMLGGDTLTATWNPPAVRDGAAKLKCHPYRNLSERFMHCQLLSEEDQPVEGTVVHFRENNTLLDSLSSGGRGWLTPINIPEGTTFISAAYNDKIQRFYVEPQPTDVLPRINALERRQHLIITQGAVREIRIETSQPVHELSSSRPTDVRVELYDVSGQVVTDEDVFVSVSDGDISEPEQTPSGAYIARYKPSGDIQFGTVKITASTLSGAYTASTSLQITPNNIRGAIGVSAGGMFISQQPLNLNTRLFLIQRSPLGEHIFGLMSIERMSLQSYDNGYRIHQNMIPISIGPSYRSSERRFNSYLDAALAITPYRLHIRYTESTILDQWGISYPGFEISTGLRYRRGAGEGFLGARFISIPFSKDSLGWNQQFTGILLEAGYLWSY